MIHSRISMSSVLAKLAPTACHPVTLALLACMTLCTGYAVDAACPIFGNNNYSNPGSPVPCKDVTTCFPADVTFNCNGGATIVAYKNSNPPSGWANCSPASGTDTCSETETACGTSLWFTQPFCNSGFSCSPQPMFSYAPCKSP